MTVKELAAHVALPEEFLRRLVRQTKRGIQIPYLDQSGCEVAIRTRLGLCDTKSAPRFRWRKGDRLLPYGLWGLEAQLRKYGYLILVEGESDCWTLWYNDFPALGIPGATTWKTEWSVYLKGFPDIYLWVESDRGGRTLLKDLADDVPNLKVILPPAGIKDAADVHKEETQ